MINAFENSRSVFVAPLLGHPDENIRRPDVLIVNQLEDIFFYKNATAILEVCLKKGVSLIALDTLFCAFSFNKDFSDIINIMKKAYMANYS